MNSAASEEGRTGANTNPDASLAEITPRELAVLLRSNSPPVLIDVREAHEHAYARIVPARLVPLATLAANIDTLPRDADLVIYCHHGVRSAYAVDMLRSAGIHSRNLIGGIERWSTEVDPSVRRY